MVATLIMTMTVYSRLYHSIIHYTDIIHQCQNFSNDLLRYNPFGITKSLKHLGSIHKPCGQIFGVFDPSVTLWTILFNGAFVANSSLYVMSTLFMNDPLRSYFS